MGRFIECPKCGKQLQALITLKSKKEKGIAPKICLTGCQTIYDVVLVERKKNRWKR